MRRTRCCSARAIPTRSGTCRGRGSRRLHRRDRRGPHGEIAPEEELYGLLKIGDQFDLVQLEADFAEEARGALATHPLVAKSDLEALGAGLPEAAIEERLGGPVPAAPLHLRSGRRIGCIVAGHEVDQTLAADVLLENLAAKVTAAMALRATAGRRGHRPRVRRLRDRQRRGGGGRSLSARGREPGEGGGRAGRLRGRDRRGRQGLLLRAHPRARDRGQPRGLGRVLARGGDRRLRARQARDEVPGAPASRAADPRGHAGGRRAARRGRRRAVTAPEARRDRASHGRGGLVAEGDRRGARARSRSAPSAGRSATSTSTPPSCTIPS